MRTRERTRLIRASAFFFTLLSLPGLLFATLFSQQKPCIFKDNLPSPHHPDSVQACSLRSLFSPAQGTQTTSSFVLLVHLIRGPSSHFISIFSSSVTWVPQKKNIMLNSCPHLQCPVQGLAHGRSLLNKSIELN